MSTIQKSDSNTQVLDPKSLEDISKTLPFFTKLNEDRRKENEKTSKSFEEMIENVLKNFETFSEENSLLIKKIEILKSDMEETSKVHEEEKRNLLETINDQKVEIEEQNELHQQEIKVLLEKKIRENKVKEVEKFKKLQEHTCYTEELFEGLNSFLPTVNLGQQNISKAVNDLIKEVELIETFIDKIKNGPKT